MLAGSFVPRPIQIIREMGHQVETTLKEAGTSDDTITSAMVHMSEGSPFTNLFCGLQTQHQQFAYLLCTFWASSRWGNLSLDMQPHLFHYVLSPNCL